MKTAWSKRVRIGCREYSLLLLTKLDGAEMRTTISASNSFVPRLEAVNTTTQAPAARPLFRIEIALPDVPEP